MIHVLFSNSRMAFSPSTVIWRLSQRVCLLEKSDVLAFLLGDGHGSVMLHLATGDRLPQMSLLKCCIKQACDVEPRSDSPDRTTVAEWESLLPKASWCGHHKSNATMTDGENLAEELDVVAPQNGLEG